MKRLLAAPALILVSACIGLPDLPDLPRPSLPRIPTPGLPWIGDDEPELEPVRDRDVLAFASRIETFYRALEGTPLDAPLTYESSGLRAHFVDTEAFSDYYASLTLQVRLAQLRNARVERIEVRQFTFESEERARVEVMLVGHHERSLRFWEMELPRTDIWTLVRGDWMLTPEKL